MMLVRKRVIYKTYVTQNTNHTFVPKAKLDVHDIVLQDIAVTQLKTNNIVAPMYAAGFKGCSRRRVFRS